MSKKTFGKLLREWRTDLEFTMKEVADSIGISVPYYSDIEHERRNPLKTEQIKQVSNLFKLDPEEENELFGLAMIKHRKVELPITKNQNKNNMAMLLAKHWNRLSDGDLSRIADALVTGGRS